MGEPEDRQCVVVSDSCFPRFASAILCLCSSGVGFAEVRAPLPWPAELPKAL